MDVSGLIRKPAAIKKNLVSDPKAGLSTKVPCSIMVQSKYFQRNLGVVGSSIKILACFAIVMGNEYSVNKANAMMEITPDSTRTVMVNGEEYSVFEFNAGSTISPSLNLVKSGILLYYISEHFYSRGDVPWFFSYDDMADLFDTAAKHAGVNLPVEPAVFEIITSSLARQQKDRTKYFRHGLKGPADAYMSPPSWISLFNVSLGATNTIAKIMGAHYNQGLTSALSNEATEMEGVEELLRR